MTPTSTPQDIYRAFAHDTTLGSSMVHIGKAFILFGILLFAWEYIVFLAKIRSPRQWGNLIFPAAYLSFAIGIVTALLGAYWSSDAVQIPAVFSNANVSQSVWETYKTQYMDAHTGRTVDPQTDGRTTSEGESYTMLRAVWLDDKETFDRSWAWTRTYLQHSDDRLFSWAYGERADGTLGVLTDIGGEHSASDADEDIALALAFAYGRWQDPHYLADAQQIIGAVWDTEIVEIDSQPYLAANNVEKTAHKDSVVVNPSYLAPYTYRIFAALDPAHPWNDLVDSSYALLQETLNSPLDKSASAGLPPDWIQIDRTNGVISAIVSTSTALSTNDSFDAMRVPWRIALDYRWNKDPRARALLDQMSFLQKQWNEQGELLESYTHNGSPASAHEAPAVYGGNMGFFLVSDTRNAGDVYRKKLLILFDPDTGTWRAPLSYYDANWVWFGMALFNNQLTNLASFALAHA